MANTFVGFPDLIKVLNLNTVVETKCGGKSKCTSEKFVFLQTWTCSLGYDNFLKIRGSHILK